MKTQSQGRAMNSTLPLSNKFQPGDRVTDARTNSKYYGKTGTVKEVYPDNHVYWQWFDVYYTPLIAVIELETGEIIKEPEKYWYKVNAGSDS